ncbi:MAG TPA: formate/nitrite transporter family protein [Thermoanaerobaculia bacterium]|jgi:formate/nitrite transporter FocA (FNT family)
MTDELDDPQARQKRHREEEKGEEPQKGYETILEQEILAGVTELERPARGLFLSGLSAGLDVSFSLLMIAIMEHLVEGRLPEPVARILVANMYAVGFLFVVLGRSELFTEHTTLAVLPVLDRRASLARLGRLWTIVYAANLAGAAAFAAFVAFLAPPLRVAEPRTFGRIAGELVSHPWWVILLSGVLAGWLMGLLSWLVAAARDTISQVFVVWLVTAAIGFAHLHHCIVGTAEVLAGVFSGLGATAGDYLYFLAFSTAGNALGGIVFVALIKYGHARSQDG